PRERTSWLVYAGMLVLFLGAMLSKTLACTLPVVIGLLVYWRHGRITPRVAAVLVPLAVLGLCLAAMTVWLEGLHSGSSEAQWAASPLERALIAGRIFWFYPRLLLWPHP